MLVGRNRVGGESPGDAVEEIICLGKCRENCGGEKPIQNQICMLPQCYIESKGKILGDSLDNEKGKHKRMLSFFRSYLNIVFVWSQLDGGKVKQRTMARFPPKPYDAKAK